MKFYLFVLSMLCLTVISCKKDRTCSCDITTAGTRTTHSESAAVTFSLNLGIPIPIPPIEISPAKDTTIIAPYSNDNTLKTNYKKVSKSMINGVCPTSFEETYSDGYTTIIPGTSTVTTTDSGTKTYSCKVE